jgi:hypothetical protein
MPKRFQSVILVVCSCFVVAILSAACSSKKSSGGPTPQPPNTLGVGTYTNGTATVTTDGCGEGDFMSGDTLGVLSFSASAISFNPPDGTTFTQFLVGTNFAVSSGLTYTTAPFTFTANFTTTAQQIATLGAALSTSYNCVVGISEAQSVTVTSADTFTFTESDTLSIGSAGSSSVACVAAMTSAGIPDFGFSSPIVGVPCATKENVSSTL